MGISSAAGNEAYAPCALAPLCFCVNGGASSLDCLRLVPNDLRTSFPEYPALIELLPVKLQCAAQR